MTQQIFYDPMKDVVYSAFVEYFANPSMTKMKDINDFSMYIARVYAILGIEYRYIIVFVKRDEFPLGSTKLLSNLSWVSLQTRSLPEEHNLSSHSYIPKRLPNLDKKISLIRKDEKQYLYHVDQLPISIVLLPTKKNRDFEYATTGSVTTALESYQTIVTFQN